MFSHLSACHHSETLVLKGAREQETKGSRNGETIAEQMAALKQRRADRMAR